jgi:hypothetical protein
MPYHLATPQWPTVESDGPSYIESEGKAQSLPGALGWRNLPHERACAPEIRFLPNVGSREATRALDDRGLYPFFTAAWAAASLAIGTRKGEHDT